MDRVSNAARKVFDDIEPAGRILVGFSGGMDSTVLLHAVASQAPVERSRIVAVHVDHGIEPESGDWARHCETVADRLGVTFVCEALELGRSPNLEARARAGRYAVFEKLMEPDDVLLLAHHLDDRDESVLLHLLQGRGLFGMPRSRPFGGGELLRPLLDLPRSMLKSHARIHDLSWLEDTGNLDTVLDRNFLRLTVLPGLRDRFPGLSERLGRVVGQGADTDRALLEVLQLARNPLPVTVFDGLTRAAAVSVLRHWLVAQDAAAGVSDAALAEYLSQLGAASDRQPELRISVGSLRRHRRLLYLVGPGPDLNNEYQVTAPGLLELPHGLLRLEACAEVPGGETAEGFMVQSPVRVEFVRGLEAGLTIRSRGHRRRVRDLLREAGIPSWERETYPVLFDAAGLLALPGLAVRDDLSIVEGQDAGHDWPRVTIIWQPSRCLVG